MIEHRLEERAPRRWLPVLSNLPARPQVGPLAASLKVLADEHRLAIVALLADRELCVCHLMEILDLPQSTISHHVGVLRRAGLVRDRRDERDGRWTYYTLDPVAMASLWRDLTGVLAGTTGENKTAQPAPPCP